MGYNFTEKKESEKFLQKNLSLDVPYLLETQLASYKAFLQKTIRTELKTEGLQAAFESVFPFQVIMVLPGLNLLNTLWARACLMLENVSKEG